MLNRVCCEMDIHKSFVVACIASTNKQGVTAYKRKRFFYLCWGFTSLCSLVS